LRLKHQSRVGSFSVERGNAFYTIYMFYTAIKTSPLYTFYMFYTAKGASGARLGARPNRRLRHPASMTHSC
jgi:hypothetical protein